MRYTRPSLLHYRLAQVVSWNVAQFIFKRKFLRNEIKGREGPFVVIANHQAAYDFVNLIGATNRPMSFVISNSFYSSLPIKGFLNRMGVIPKQQFQTSVHDMKAMKAVIDAGQVLAIYPAGLMCEDGLSTPIPRATYKFLKWLKADVYVARTRGAYFVMPKWGKGMRPGRTTLDIYKLFSKEELAELELDEIRARTDEALLFDAYREQEELRVAYRNNHNIEGLEHVLYMCPHCGREFTMEAQGGNTIRCTACGFAQRSDEYAFFHKQSDVGEELRYVSDWSRWIYETQKDRISREEETSLSALTAFHMVDGEKSRFAEVGRGTVTLTRDGFLLQGTIDGEPVEMTIPIANTPTLPFGPGRYLEIQQGEKIYRCVLEDGKLVMKFINMLKGMYELNMEAGKTVPV